MQKSKFRKGLVVAVIVLFIGTSVVPSIGMVEKSNNGRSILYVGGSGPGNYTSIQDAIDNTSNGDTVFVYNGTYYENVVIDITINLNGEDRNNTIIDGGGSGDVVYVSADWVNISGFTIQNSGSEGYPQYHSGIQIVSNFTNVSNNTIVDNNRGIWCRSDNNSILDNYIVSNTNQGLELYLCNHNLIQGNNLSYGTYGVKSDGDSQFNSILENNIFGNSIIGIYFDTSSSNNLIYHNNLINNTQNAYDECSNTWDSGYPSGGNYYDDYSGEDSDSDGIGDTSYSIPGGSNQDLYPLMYPWYPTHPDTVYVDDDYDNSTPGWGYDRFNRIQYGINEVEGSTVYVYSGTYYESLIIDKSNLILIGEDKDSTIIDANDLPDGLYVTKNNFSIINFTIRNGYQDGIVIRSSSNCEINNCILYNFSFDGIVLYSYTDGEANNNSISNCSIFNNGKNGIRLYGRYNDMKSNRIVDSNVFSNSEHGIIFDGDYQKDFNIVSGNNISSNSRHGIRFIESNKNTITQNNLISNKWDGIYLYNSSNNIMAVNNIVSNIDFGICLDSYCNDNTIYNNNFVNNTLQNAYDYCNNTWDNGYPSGGNYWDDYTEEDLYSGPNQDIPGPDGIGDTPYNITGGDNQDMYPLMYPFELYYMLNISAPPEVNEGESFNVVVTSIGGPVVPNATVEFNDELKLTDSGGRAYFIAPQVGEDTYYDIITYKEGYTGDTETILVKDVPDEFVSTFMFGRITNLNTTGEHITFEAVNVRTITFSPFSFIPYTSGELIRILKDYTGLLGALFGVQFIFATCDASIG